MAWLEQYSCRECLELIVSLKTPTGIDLRILSVMQTFEIAAVNNEKCKFYTIHQLGNNKTVLAKLVNQRDTIK